MAPTGLSPDPPDKMAPTVLSPDPRSRDSVETSISSSVSDAISFPTFYMTGQTTVNKKAPIHYIIPLNVMVHRLR